MTAFRKLRDQLVNARADLTRADLVALRPDIRDVLRQFADAADPRKHIGELSDDAPVLLMPLRIETRFKRVAGRRRGEFHDQLWVRVFPDTCMVDSFEDDLSAVELESARRYWQAVWRSGGSEDGERAAWRNLVASHGSGRARWIVGTYAPENSDDRPEEVRPETIVLVVPVDDSTSEDERTALAAYWEAAWRAGAAGPAEAEARRALADAVGSEERATELIAATVPLGLHDRPPADVSPEKAVVETVVAVFPAVKDPKSRSWSLPAHVTVLPDRLLCMVDSGGQRIEALGHPIPWPLQVSPDPSGQPELKRDGADLEVPDELRWMTDFSRAVKDGLGFRINLTPEQASSGADRVLVVGVRLSESPEEGAKRLEELIAHHRDSRTGFSLLKQGTPTNNTEAANAGYSRSEDPDARFDEMRNGDELPQVDPADRLDGSFLADALGIDPKVVGGAPGAWDGDQREARAMNVALWPATLGYFLDTTMAPLVSDDTAEQIRWFFTSYVSGRGAVPPVRIGAQPYGILPATAFARTKPDARDERHAGFLRRLLEVVGRVDKDWDAFSTQVASLGRPGADPQATLLEVLGLHPDSAEFHFRYAESLDHLFNFMGLFGFGEALFQAIVQFGLDAPAQDLLADLGIGADRPAILDKYFLGSQGKLLGDIVDDRPPSETDPIRAWTTDGRNYLQWIERAARKSLETLRRQEGFIDGRHPTALLYLLMRHALLLGYSDAAVGLHRAAGRPEAELLAMKSEPAFVHVATGTPTESRWAPLIEVNQAVTGDPQRSVAEFIADKIGKIAPTGHLAEQIEALRRLEDVPTARLERLLAEHLDTCAYRFDSWRLGLVHHQLEEMRRRRPRGVYLGAVGWLEDVRRSTAVRERAVLSRELTRIFQHRGDAPLETDSANGGYIHAPSLDHAVTASVLRAGYLANASPSNPDALAVNLSSERVRLALETLEGMRNGQSLAALLGYRLERTLHDAGGVIEADRFILPLRKSFPLVADRLAPTQTGADVPADAVAARNVVDGLRLVEHVNSHPGEGGYPFGDATLPAATGAEKALIDGAVDRLRDVHDAIGDLTLAESVHQAAQGRYDTAAAALEVVAGGSYPPEPEVVRTPRRGIALTHRLALHFDPNAAAPAGATARALAEPRLDAWLASVLPQLDDIACRVTWTDPRTHATGQADVTMADLGLRPIDLLWVVFVDGGHAMAELDDRVAAHVLASGAVPLDASPEIGYLDAIPGKLRVFDVAAHVRRARQLVSRARPLRPGDAAPANDATRAVDSDVALDRARVADAQSALESVRDDLEQQAADLTALLDADPVDAQAILAGIDAAIDTTAALFERAARFGVPQTGWGFAYRWRQEEARALLGRVSERVEVWNARLEDFQAMIDEFDSLPAEAQDAERLIRLRRAEISVSAGVSDASNLAALRASLPAQATAFTARRDDLAAVAAAPPATYSALVAAVEALLPLTDVDLDPFDLDEEGKLAVAFAGDLVAAIGVVAADVRARALAAAGQLSAHDSATDAPARVEALTRGAQAIFGEDFRLVPDGGVPAAQASEVSQAQAASRAGILTSELTAGGVDFPVDEWLTGVARVRDQARAWEQVALGAEAFGLGQPGLTPMQFPFVADDDWLALRFPDDAVLDRDRLLYTAYLPAGFDPAARVCGLLLDEWTEVIPGRSESTGIAVHYDRPSSEPPQSMLLVTPAVVDGRWQWEDVLGAIDDTLGLMRKRAVEPVHVDASRYARFLPSTIMSTTLHGLSIGLTLALNNHVERRMEEG